MRRRDWTNFFTLTVALAVVALLFLAAMPAPAREQAAGQSYPLGIFRSGSLDVTVTSPSVFHFGGPSGTGNLTFHVNNARRYPVDVLLAVDQDDQWNVIADLGSLPPGGSGDFSYAASFSYGGKTSENDTFGVLASSGAGGITGKAFRVGEDWSGYEQSLKSQLSLIGVPLAVILLIILAVVMAGTLAKALGDHHGGDGEYTIRTLFFPMAQARPLAEKIADIILTPFFWVSELLVGSGLILLILVTAIRGVRPDIGILVFFVGGVAAIFMPLIFLVMAWLADYYKREPFRFVVAMFMWGVMSTMFAFCINTATLQFTGLFIGTDLALAVSAVIFAPIVEETTKGLGLLILSGHHEFDSAFDGILFGFAVGMGFAAVENWLYFVTNYSPVTAGGLVPWGYLILYRSFLGSLSHGCFTAATGGIIGLFKSHPRLRRHTLIAFLIGLPVAICLHSAGNLIVIIGSIGESALGLPVPVFDPLYTLGLTTIYIIIGVVLQLRIRGRLLKRGPKPEG